MSGNGHLSDLPAFLNGKTKGVIALVGILWSALLWVLGFAIGGASQASALQEHADEGHPVMVQRMNGIEARVFDRLNSIDRRLARIEDRLEP